jgi:hypothetical protein
VYRIQVVAKVGVKSNRPPSWRSIGSYLRPVRFVARPKFLLRGAQFSSDCAFPVSPMAEAPDVFVQQRDRGFRALRNAYGRGGKDPMAAEIVFIASHIALSSALLRISPFSELINCRFQVLLPASYQGSQIPPTAS